MSDEPDDYEEDDFEDDPYYHEAAERCEACGGTGWIGGGIKIECGECGGTGFQ